MNRRRLPGIAAFGITGAAGTGPPPACGSPQAVADQLADPRTGRIVRPMRSVYLNESKAVGDGSTDDTAAIQNFLDGFAEGAEVLIPGGLFYAILSADLTIPPNVIVRGLGGSFGNAMSGNWRCGSGFILDPVHSIVLSNSSALRDLAILRRGLAASPTEAEAVAAVAQWGTETSVGLFIPPNINQSRLDNITIIGFNTGFKAEAGEWSATHLMIDSFNGVEVSTAGDNHYLDDCRCEPFYAMATDSKSGSWDRPGVAFRFHDGNTGSILTRLFSFMWHTGILFQNNGVAQLVNSGFEVGGRVTIAGDTANTYGVRFLGANAQVSLNNVYCNGFNTCISDEGRGEIVILNCSTAPQGTPPGHGAHHYLATGSHGLISNANANMADGSPVIRAAEHAGAWKICNVYASNGAPAATWAVIHPSSLASLSLLNVGIAGSAPSSQIQTHLNEKVWITTDPSVTVVDQSAAATLTVEASTPGILPASNLSLWRSGVPIGSIRTMPAGATQPGIALMSDVPNGSIMLAPAGSGALILGASADDVTVEGQVRGERSVDLQSCRSAGAQVASGALSVIIGGAANTAAGLKSFAGGGSSTASGDTSFAFGFNHLISGARSSAPGGGAGADHGRSGVFIWSADPTAPPGSRQVTCSCWGTTTVCAARKRLTADSLAAASNNVLNITSNAAFSLDITVIARADQGISVWKVTGAILCRGSDAATTTLLGFPVLARTHNSAESWAVSAIADTVHAGLNLTVTGESSTTVNWTASIVSTEVS